MKFRKFLWRNLYRISNYLFKLKVELCLDKGKVSGIIPLEYGYDIPHCSKCGVSYIQEKERKDLCFHP